MGFIEIQGIPAHSPSCKRASPFCSDPREKPHNNLNGPKPPTLGPHIRCKPRFQLRPHYTHAAMTFVLNIPHEEDDRWDRSQLFFVPSSRWWYKTACVYMDDGWATLFAAALYILEMNRSIRERCYCARIFDETNAILFVAIQVMVKIGCVYIL